MFDLIKIKCIKNRKYLEKHLNQAKLDGLSERRKKDIYMRMRIILNDHTPQKDFFKLEREELDSISLSLQDHLKSYYSIESYIQTIRKFVRVNLDLDSSDSLPKKFKGIKVPKNRSKYKMFKGVEEIINPSQAFEFVKKSKTKRDAFIFMVLLDAGLRPHELLKSKRRDILKNELNYWYIQVPKATKTGFRKVMLILSIPFVEDYLKTLSSDPNTKLIEISHTRVAKMIKELSKVTPYILRHSSASFYGSYLNEMEMLEKMIWLIYQ